MVGCFTAVFKSHFCITIDVWTCRVRLCKFQINALFDFVAKYNLAAITYKEEELKFSQLKIFFKLCFQFEMTIIAFHI